MEDKIGMIKISPEAYSLDVLRGYLYHFFLSFSPSRICSI